MIRLFLALVTLALLAATGRAAEPPRGRIAYSRMVAGGSYKIHVMNADGTGSRELPGQTDHFNYFPTWSPDGKRLSYSSMGREGTGQHVNICNADGSGLVSLTGPGGNGWLSAWSPDGEQLVFASGQGDTIDAYVADADGTNVRVLNPARRSSPAAFWLPDGKRIGFNRFEDGKFRLRLTTLADGAEETVTEGQVRLLFGPNALSPDGKRLAAIAQDQQQKRSLHIIDIAAKSDTLVCEFEITNPLFAALPLPAWAPDGRALLVPMQTDKGMGLFRVSEDGTEKARLTPEGVTCASGAWTSSP